MYGRTADARKLPVRAVNPDGKGAKIQRPQGTLLISLIRRGRKRLCVWQGLAAYKSSHGRTAYVIYRPWSIREVGAAEHRDPCNVLMIATDKPIILGAAVQMKCPSKG